MDLEGYSIHETCIKSKDGEAIKDKKELKNEIFIL